MKIPKIETEYEQIRESYLDKWSDYYPRRIVCPMGYIDPKYYSLSIWNSYFMPNLSGTNVDDVIHNAVRKMVEFKVPTYFVDPQFAFDCAATHLPKDFTFKDVYFPLDAFLLVLPQSFTESIYGYTMPYIGVAVLRKGEKARTGYEIQEVGTDTALFHVPFIGPQSGNMISYAGWFPLSESLSCLDTADDTRFEDGTKVQEDLMRVLNAGWEDIAKQDKVPDEKEEQALLHRAIRTAVLVLTVFGTNQDSFLKTGSLIRPVKKNKRGEVEKEALWNPHFIGSGYKIVTEKISLGGTHASPRFHFRRKHLHKYWYGPKKSLSKVIWIKAIPVNKDKITQKTD